MIIIHDVVTLPRIVGTALAERVKVMPAVVVTGARQTGKSTLAEHLVPGERHYASLDDLDVLDLARHDPEGLLGGERPLTLDEVSTSLGCYATCRGRASALVSGRTVRNRVPDCS